MSAALSPRSAPSAPLIVLGIAMLGVGAIVWCATESSYIQDLVTAGGDDANVRRSLFGFVGLGLVAVGLITTLVGSTGSRAGWISSPRSSRGRPSWPWGPTGVRSSRFLARGSPVRPSRSRLDADGAALTTHHDSGGRAPYGTRPPPSSCRWDQCASTGVASVPATEVAATRAARSARRRNRTAVTTRPTRKIPAAQL